MTVTNLYLLLAREVTTDASDNMTSIIKMIEKFTFGINREEAKKNNIKLGSQSVVLPASFFIASSWSFDQKLEKDTFLTLKIHVIDPNGKDLGGPEQESFLPAGINKVNMNFNSQGIPITNEGPYLLRAELYSKSGKLLAFSEYPFEVEFQK